MARLSGLGEIYGQYDGASAEGTSGLRFLSHGVSFEGRTFRGWTDWLNGLPWTTYATLTFANSRGRTLSRCGDRIVQWIWRATGQRSLAFTCGEYGRRTGRFHCHALVTHGNNGRDFLDREWRRRWGLTSLQSYVRGRGAAGYVGKYALKDAYNTGSYYLSGSGPGFEKWERLQIRAEVPRKIQEGDPSTPWEEETSAEKKGGQDAEAMRKWGACWWVDEQRKTGYNQYLGGLAPDALQNHVDRFSTRV